MECMRLSGCQFIDKCSTMGLEDTALKFIKMYCEGCMQDRCIRLNLLDKFGDETVPENMTPNGSPLPGTTTAGWDEKAVKFRFYI